MLKKLLIILSPFLFIHICNAGDHDFYPGDYSKATIIGISLPGSFRPFSADSPWNTPIPKDAKTHPLSDLIIRTMAKERKHLSVVKEYQTPIWVVNSKNMKLVKFRGTRIFDAWDEDHDGITDIGAPVTPDMWGEPTGDGQICIVDPFRLLLWDISTYKWVYRNGKPLYPTCTTYDIWDLNGKGVANPKDGTKWKYLGGRGSGFPGIAGVLRPEEIEYGKIRHALVFSFNKIRKDEAGAQIFYPPACRSDGKYIGIQYPVMGMRFQLDPSLTEDDFRKWGIKSRAGIIVAKALQEYGMYLGISGGPLKLIIQLLAPDPKESNRIWKSKFPHLYKDIEKIPIKAFRIIYTGEPRVRYWIGTENLNKELEKWLK